MRIADCGLKKGSRLRAQGKGHGAWSMGVKAGAQRSEIGSQRSDGKLPVSCQLN
jgi:hypothetical protein